MAGFVNSLFSLLTENYLYAKVAEMARPALSENTRLQMVGGSVSPAVRDALARIAESEKRPVAQIVRRLLEESPEVQKILRKRKAA